MSKKYRSEQMHKAAVAREKVVEEMLGRQNVVACGLGYKIRGNEITNEPSVMVSVTHKVPQHELSDDDLVPHAVEDVPTDVIETGEIRALSLERQARVRPVRPGVSIGHLNGSAGTAACLVERGSERFILSNNHVVALLNEGEEEDAILQPGPGDGGTLLDQIGTLAEYVPLRFQGESIVKEEMAAQSEERQGCAAIAAGVLNMFRNMTNANTAKPPPIGPQYNYVDAGLVAIGEAIDVRSTIIDVGGAPLGIIPPDLGMRIIKSGRTTGLTQGSIIQVDVTVDVRYGERLARFTDQIMSSPISQPGDSGSLVLDYERNAVGLLFSGSDAVSILNPIDAVLKALNVNLVMEA